MLVRRRKSPTYWSIEQLEQQVRAAYVAPIENASPPAFRVGFVFHQDRSLYLRRMMRWADREAGGFVPFCAWSVWWDEILIQRVQMGDDRHDVFQGYSGHHNETAARAAARAFLDEDPDAGHTSRRRPSARFHHRPGSVALRPPGRTGLLRLKPRMATSKHRSTVGATNLTFRSAPLDARAGAERVAGW